MQAKIIKTNEGHHECVPNLTRCFSMLFTPVLEKNSEI